MKTIQVGIPVAKRLLAGDTRRTLLALAALAQQTRLALFRLLVQSGPDGLAAGELAERLRLANATLSFHLKELAHAGLVNRVQEGRFIYYSANYAAIDRLLGYLTENCCAGADCAVECGPTKRKSRGEST